MCKSEQILLTIFSKWEPSIFIVHICNFKVNFTKVNLQSDLLPILNVNLYTHFYFIKNKTFAAL